MKKANKFYYWYKKIGGNIAGIDFDSVIHKLNDPKMKVSSLKNNALEIKEKHNHKFNFSNR